MLLDRYRLALRVIRDTEGSGLSALSKLRMVETVLCTFGKVYSCEKFTGSATEQTYISMARRFIGDERIQVRSREIYVATVYNTDFAVLFRRTRVV